MNQVDECKRNLSITKCYQQGLRGKDLSPELQAESSQFIESAKRAYREGLFERETIKREFGLSWLDESH